MNRTLPVLLALALCTTPALAGSQGEPEIPDETGDVDVQHLVDAGLLEDEPVSQDQAEQVGDIAAAWVHTETEASFQVTVQLAEIPDQENTSAPLMEAWVHWTINENEPRYHAQAVLVSPQPGAPLQADYQLYEGSSKLATMPGSVDTHNDTLRFTVPKAPLGGVGEGDEFTQAYATTHLPVSQATVDYAPGARSENVPATQQDLSGTDPTSLSLSPDPEFGPRTYAFQDFTAPEGDLSLTVTPSSLEIPAGDRAKISVRVQNNADEADTAQLSVGGAPTGWSASLDAGTLEVPAGEDRRTFLTVSPAEDAEGLEFVDLTASSSFSGEVTKTVAVTATQPADGGSGGGASGDDTTSSTDSPGSDTGATGSSGSGDGSSSPAGDGSESTKDSPGLGPVALLGALAAAAVGWRRRGA